MLKELCSKYSLLPVKITIKNVREKPKINILKLIDFFVVAANACCCWGPSDATVQRDVVYIG
jgi:hypothetical protein